MIRYAVKCTFERAAFSSELLFSVKPVIGSEIGTADRQYCWRADMTRPASDEPVTGQSIEGIIAVRRLQDEGAGQCLVLFPDGDTRVILEKELVMRPEAT